MPLPNPADVQSAAARRRLTLAPGVGWNTVRDGRRLCCPAAALAIDADPSLLRRPSLDRAGVLRATGLPPDWLHGLVRGWTDPSGISRTDALFVAGYEVGRELARTAR